MNTATAPQVIPVYADPFASGRHALRKRALEIATKARLAGFTFAQPKRAPRVQLIWAGDSAARKAAPKAINDTGHFGLDAHKLIRLVGYGVSAGVVISLFCRLFVL